MKISSTTKTILAEIILGDGNEITYRSGPALVDFFNDFQDVKDLYVHGNFPSRIDYVKRKINELISSNKIKKFLEEVFHVVHFGNSLEAFNNVLTYFNPHASKDGFVIEVIETQHGVYGKMRSLLPGLVELKSKRISHEYVIEQIEKCKLKISDPTPDLDGAITNSRSLTEIVMEFVLKEIGIEIPEYDGNLLQLYKVVKKHFKLDANKDLSDVFNQILSGLNNIVNGLGGISNKMSDRHARQYKPQPYHAKLAVNSAFTLCEFLLDALDRKKKELH